MDVSTQNASMVAMFVYPDMLVCGYVQKLFTHAVLDNKLFISFAYVVAVHSCFVINSVFFVVFQKCYLICVDGFFSCSQ